jgi:hypothetical protein
MRSVSRLLFAIAVLSLLISSPFAASAKDKPATASSATPFSLLEEAEHISRGFIPDDRTALLLEAAESAVPVNKPKAEAWAMQLFSVSRTSLEPGHYRQAMEKNALTVLARIDPVRAAQLFRQQDPPDVKDFPNEDVRSFAAITLFQLLWEKKGKAALPKIEELANWLGSTGQYPYPAMASLILELSKSDSRKAAALYGSAVSFLPRDPGYLNTNRLFANMILKVRAVVPQSLLRQAITEEISAIERRKDLRKGTSRYVVSGASGSHTFDSEGPVLVYRLLPVVQQMDPEWAVKLKNDFGLTDMTTPGLDEQIAVSGASTPPGQEESASDPELQAALDAHRLIQSQQLSERDPKAAAQLAQQITDPALRSVALVTAAPTYAKLDADQAGAWVSGARQQLNSLAPSVKKLRLMIALIKVSIANGNREDARQQASKAYDLGEELFEDDLRGNPGKLSDSADGFEELTDLTSVAARQPWLSAETLDHVRQLRNDVLRARLLVEQAKGMEQGNATG